MSVGTTTTGGDVETCGSCGEQVPLGERFCSKGHAVRSFAPPSMQPVANPATPRTDTMALPLSTSDPLSPPSVTAPPTKPTSARGVAPVSDGAPGGDTLVIDVAMATLGALCVGVSPFLPLVDTGSSVARNTQIQHGLWGWALIAVALSVVFSAYRRWQGQSRFGRPVQTCLWAGAFLILVAVDGSFRTVTMQATGASFTAPAGMGVYVGGVGVLLALIGTLRLERGEAGLVNHADNAALSAAPHGHEAAASVTPAEAAGPSPRTGLVPAPERVADALNRLVGWTRRKPAIATVLVLAVVIGGPLGYRTLFPSDQSRIEGTWQKFTSIANAVVPTAQQLQDATPASGELALMGLPGNQPNEVADLFSTNPNAPCPVVCSLSGDPMQDASVIENYSSQLTALRVDGDTASATFNETPKGDANGGSNQGQVAFYKQNGTWLISGLSA